MEAIVEVTEEPGQLPLDIQTQATEEPVQDRAERCFLARTPEQAQGYYESRGVGAEERDLARSGWGRGLSARTFKNGGEFSPDCKSVVASSPPGRVGVDSPDGRRGLMGMCPGVDLTCPRDGNPGVPRQPSTSRLYSSAGQLRSANTAVSEQETETSQVITLIYCVLPKHLLKS